MTSVLNSGITPAHAVKKHGNTSASTRSGDAGPDAASEFGALFGAMMAPDGRQNLAAAEGKTSPAVTGLAAEVLGPTVQIITTATPATSDESLMAFARAQGMDEDALSLIFRGGPLTGAPGTPAGAGDGLTSPPSPGLSAATVNPDAEGMQQLALGPEATLRWQVGESAAPAQPAAAAINASSVQTAMFGLNGTRPLLPSAEVAATEAELPADPESARHSLAASLILGAAEAAQFSRRQQMKQLTERSEKLAQAFTDTQRALAGGTAPGGGPEIPVDAPALVLAEDVLDISALATDTDTGSPMLSREPGSESRPATTSPSATTAAPARAEQSVRAEQYERLSQRLGEALGQRLAAQIARGEWKVELALKPHELGAIEIELQMKQGALEASFSASQSATRELIADSLPRLKEVLAQLGMDVATMNVNVRQNGQNGGNPTPGRQPHGAATGAVAGKSASEPASALPAATQATGGKDGLDVLV